jgi:hypothetical protein
MARTNLTPTILAADNAVSNLTTLLTTAGNANALVPATGSGNGVQFTNIPGQTQIGFSLGSTACTATVQVGMAGLPGLSTTTYSITLPVSSLSFIGGFHSILSQAGTQIVAIDFSSATALVVALFQEPAVY